MTQSNTGLVALLRIGAVIAALWALPFLFVFAGGIAADLLETEHRRWALAGVFIILASNQIVRLFDSGA